MELLVYQVIKIAEKLTRMEDLDEDSLGFGIHQANSVAFDTKNRNHYFYIRYDKNNKTADVTIFVGNLEQHKIQLKAIFLKLGGHEIASRLVITESGISTNYITLPHFVTLKEEFKKSLLK
jgi:hypothetical protein